MLRRLREWLGLPGLTPEARLRRILRQEGPPAAPADQRSHEPVRGTVTAGQASVLIAVDSTLADDDRRRAARLRAAQEHLVTAAAANDLAWQSFQNAAWGSPWSRHSATLGSLAAARGDPPAAQPPAARSTHRRRSHQEPVVSRDFDRYQPLLSGRKLAIMELIFVIVEVFFWFGVFTENIDRSASGNLHEWVGAGLLAIFLPLAGIASARLLGQLGHRLVAGYPGVGAREWLGMGLAALTVGAAGVATFYLVHLRFADPPLGVTSLPAVPMALIFVIVLVADVVARMFLRSELHEQRLARNATLDTWTGRVIAANRAHTLAWVRLRTEVQVQLNRCERIVAVGADLIAAAIAQPAAADANRVAIGELRDAHRPANPPEGTVPLAVPNPEQLHMFGVPLAVGPVRVVADAIDALARWQPSDSARIAAELAELRRRWYGVVDRVVDGSGGAATPGTAGAATDGAQSGGVAGSPARAAEAERGTAGGRPVPRQLNNHREQLVEREEGA